MREQTILGFIPVFFVRNLFLLVTAQGGYSENKKGELSNELLQ
jgi:hypothetical protein